MMTSPALSGIFGVMYIVNSELAFAIRFVISKLVLWKAPIGTDVAADSSTFPENELTSNVISSWLTGTPATGTPNPKYCAISIWTSEYALTSSCAIVKAISYVSAFHVAAFKHSFGWPFRRH